jgi:tetratricopeptide (TPR) repeat protein
MQFIEGRTVAALIEDLRAHAGVGDAEPTGPAQPDAATTPQPLAALATEHSSTSPAYFRTVARLGVQAAEGLEHAHQLGVLHRDIKPANLLVDVRGNLWITDFGLARLQSDPGLTLTGDLLGTLRYMSPEQALARRMEVDQRTDVYSLGATLYELLTLQPACTGRDREEVLRQISLEEPRPPRKLNKAIPRELETIVLKAIQKRPGDRYTTAQELADDLERFLKHEPILARRVSSWERGVKWARRRPALAGLLTVSAAALLTLLVGGWVYNVRLEAALRDAREQRTRAEANFERAEANFQEARQAVDKYFKRVSENRLLQVPGMQPLRKELLEEALAYYQRFLQQHRDDITLVQDVAQVEFYVADILEQIGDPADALAAYERSRARWEQIGSQGPDDWESKTRLARNYWRIGKLRAKQGQRTEALQAYQQARALHERSIGERPNDLRFPGYLTPVLHDLANLQDEMGRRTDAEQSYERALSLAHDLVAKAPDNAGYLESLARLCCDVGNRQSRLGARVQGLQSLQLAQGILQKLVADHPANPEYQNVLANNCRNIGIGEWAAQRQAEALKSFEQSCALLQKLADQNPEVTEYQRRLADAHDSIAGAHERTRPAEALPSWRQAVALRERLARKHPDSLPLQAEFATTSRRLAIALRGTDQYAEALRADEQTRVVWEKLVSKAPDNLGYRSELGATWNGIAIALNKLGRHEEALGAYQKAVQSQRMAHDKAPQVSQYREYLGFHYAKMADVQLYLGRHADAAATVRQYQELWPRDANKLHEAARALARCSALVGKVKTDLTAEEQTQRRRYADEALAALRQAIAHGYKNLTELKEGQDLAPLRSREEFQKLLAELETKTRP